MISSNGTSLVQWHQPVYLFGYRCETSTAPSSLSDLTTNLLYNAAASYRSISPDEEVDVQTHRPEYAGHLSRLRSGLSS